MSTDVNRPIFHFSPRKNWMNDPNGLVYLNGTYHLFFQYNPEGNDWGNMSWGHATSTDLLSWTEQDLALPHTPDEQIFSGSIVVDHTNTTGFGKHGIAPLVAVYTRVASDGVQAQALACSLDQGATWAQYHANPVLDRNSTAFRDPKVFRAADRHGRERWVMVAVEAEQRTLLVYSSHNLIAWTYESTFGPFGDDGLVWECPDLFPMNINQDSAKQAWVLMISTNKVPDHDSATFYLTGTFDGHAFTAGDPEIWHPLDHGRDFYAAVSFAETPGEERIILGWANNWQYAASTPTHPWRGAMTLPRQLTLTEAGLRQCLPAVAESALPAEPDQTYRTESFAAPVTFDAGGHYRFRLRCTLDGTTEVSVSLLSSSGIPAAVLCYDAHARELTFDRPRSGQNDFHPQFPETSSVQLRLADDLLELDVFVDGSIIEVFANQGDTAMTMQAFPHPGAGEVVLSKRGGALGGVAVELYDLTRLHHTDRLPRHDAKAAASVFSSQ